MNVQLFGARVALPQPGAVWQAVFPLFLALLGTSLYSLRLGLTCIRYSRVQLERGEQASGMAKAIIIGLIGLGIVAVALFAALRAAGGKIQSQMNQDY